MRKGATAIFGIVLQASVIGCSGQEDGGGGSAVSDAGAGSDLDSGPVDAGPRRLEMMAPARIRSGDAVPIRLRVLRGERTDLYYSGNVALSVSAGAVGASEIRVQRGVGSVTTGISGSGAVELIATGAGAEVRRALELVETVSARELLGPLEESDLLWRGDEEIRILGDTSVSSGQTLVIEAGARIRLGGKANLTVFGALECQGTIERPVLFAPLESDEPWGGVIHSRSTGDYAYTFMVGGGADAAKAFGHSGSQAVLFSDHGELSLSHTVIIDNVGKSLGASGARISMDSSLVSRCDTGGQLDDTYARITGCHFLEIPSDDGVFADDDNDGIYFLGAFVDQDGARLPSEIEGSVFSVGKDDGIDQNGADLEIAGCFLEGFTHEGIACSESGQVSISDTYVSGCEQGIEAGYGAPEVFVDHCLLSGNQVGLRFGDSYSWEVNGTFTVTNSIAVDNAEHNVLNYVKLLDGAREGRVHLSYSMVDDPEWDQKDNNLPGKPLLDETYHLREGSLGRAAGSDKLDLGLLR